MTGDISIAEVLEKEGYKAIRAMNMGRGHVKLPPLLIAMKFHLLGKQ